MRAFTPDKAGALSGPDWLRTRRASAAAALADLALPSSEEEVWRYSRVEDLDLDRWHPADASAGGTAPADGAVAGVVNVTVVDGNVTISDVPAELTAQGVIVAAASTLDEDVAALGAVTGADDIFVRLNDAFVVEPIVISVPRGVRVEQPIVVHHHLTETDGAVFPRLVVRVGENAEVRVLDRVTSGPDAVLSVPVTELDVARGARLSYVHLQELGAAAWQIGNLVGRIDQEADLKAALIGLGGAVARIRTDIDLAGRGANGDLLAAYFGSDDQMLDFRTFQNHNAADTTSDLLFKGAVGGRSRSVYTGLIRVDKAARGTNAFQTNRNLKLSDDAWAESVPNLEIETDDVRCSHASTVGPVDPEQHFYLESRGVPPHEADRLIVAGFFDEVVRALPVAEAIAPVRQAIAAKLDAVSADLA